jgi:hypothetical protein
LHRQQIYLVSPEHPCGAAWLANCFLELGILTYYSRYWQNMWRYTKGHYTLTPWHDYGKAWLPSLSAREYFRFDLELKVHFLHHWPHKRFAGAKIIFFDRDPLDAIHSAYRRFPGNISFNGFASILDAYTLLDQGEMNALFYRAWLSQSRVKRFRFEDYKADPVKTLSSVLEYSGGGLDIREGSGSRTDLEGEPIPPND